MTKFEDLFSDFLGLQGVRARFGCQCVTCKRSEVELRKAEKAKKEDG